MHLSMNDIVLIPAKMSNIEVQYTKDNQVQTEAALIDTNNRTEIIPLDLGVTKE